MSGRTKRWGARWAGADVELALREDCELGDEGEVVTYVAMGHYVYRRRPDGTMKQVCERLRYRGITLMLGQRSLLEVVRQHARLSFAEEDREFQRGGF